jgi:glycosidase
VRRDVPGGWQEDQTNSFVASGRTKEQNDAYDFMKKLLDWRKTKSVIHQGKLIHFIPEENIYVYFRILGTEIVMVIMNGTDKATTIATKRFEEVMKGKIKGKNALTGEVLQDISTIKIPAMNATILELE